MLELIVPALIGLIPSLIGWYASVQVMKAEIKNLQQRVDKHNNVVERTYALETEVSTLKQYVHDMHSAD